MQLESIFENFTSQAFVDKSLAVFRHQYKHNSLYRDFVKHLSVNPMSVERLEQIPFLPIQFFKSHRILSEASTAQMVFTSSGTQGTTSKHYVKDLQMYIQSYRKTFERFYGDVAEYTILALLPAYLEREGSSLIYMVNDFIHRSKHPESGFYLHQLKELAATLTRLDAQGKKIVLIGVSFALLDLIEAHQFKLKHTIVMETGGMKGRRKEITRAELHQRLSKGFGLSSIHSEYGMTELLSQGYSKGQGLFDCPPWMKVLIRDPEDPLSILHKSKTGGINIIDLANIHSCAFIATQDLGKLHENGQFEVLGRFDHADIRGCNLLTH